MYYLGVDGGGTKTKYLLIDKNLKKVCELEGKTIHIHQVVIERIKEELINNLKKLCFEGNIKEKDIEYSFLGVPGYGESKEEFILSYTGGVFKAGDLILNPLKDLINESGLKCILQEPKLDPWYGSALLAYNLAGNIVPDNVEEILK